MNSKTPFKEIIIIIVAALILGIIVSFPQTSFILSSAIYMLIIIALNVIAKKITAYYFESDIQISFWSWYQFWFRKDSHFKKPIPMLWVPLILTFLSRGLFWWLAILSFDVKAKTERVSRRHGLYRFTEMTDWHIALIAVAGIIVNLFAAVVFYFAGLETLAKLSIYYSVWSIVPISNLDGTKILASSRILWFTMFVILAIFLGWGIAIV